jgi:Transposase IS116/IS110/IS902 family
MGQKIADNATRDGVAERLPEPAVQTSIAVDLALIDHDDHWRRDMELCVLKTAKQHDANTLDLLPTVPGIGEILSLVVRYDIHAIQRFPRVHEFVSYGRVVKCAKASAGKRYGPSGPKRGNAYLQWAFSEAAVLFLRAHPAGQKSRARVEKTQSKGKALTVLAHKLARAVYDRLPRTTAFDLPPFLRGYGSAADEPDASLAAGGMSLAMMLWHEGDPASANAEEHVGSSPRSLRVEWTSASAPSHRAMVTTRLTCAAPPPSLVLTGERNPFSHFFEEDGPRGQIGC